MYIKKKRYIGNQNLNSLYLLSWGGISNGESYSIRACFEKGVFYNGQFTAIC